VGLRTDLGHGWILDNKIYTYRYWNKQNYNNTSVQANGFFAPAAKSITATSAVDKLNGYRRVGDTTTVSHQDRYGILRAGLWFERVTDFVDVSLEAVAVEAGAVGIEPARRNVDRR